MTNFHPRTDDHGKMVVIKKLSRPSPIENFDNPAMIATVVPDGDRPLELNGIAFKSWTDHPRTIDEWEHVDGQIVLDEPEFTPAKGMKTGSGVIITEPDGRIWVIHPTNQFGGYAATFPKGTLEDSLSMQASAIKEAYEESGLKVEITGFIGDIMRSTSVTRYYTAKRVGGDPTEMGWESQSVSLIPGHLLYQVANSPYDKAQIDSFLSCSVMKQEKLTPAQLKKAGEIAIVMAERTIAKMATRK